MAEPTMNFVRADLGFSTADADAIELRFRGGDLTLSFNEWKEQRREVVFHEAVAFRWQELEVADLRDDATYEVRGSEWLHVQAQLQGENPDGLIHHLLRFNTHGSLDVLSRGLLFPTEDATPASPQSPVPSGTA